MCDYQIYRSTWREFLTPRVNMFKYSISRALETLGLPHTNPRSLKALSNNLFAIRQKQNNCHFEQVLMVSSCTIPSKCANK